MTEQDYLINRVEDQIIWYEKRSAWNKRWYLRLKIIELFLALLIPLLTAYITTEATGLKLAVGLIGLFVAAVSGLITLYKFQENWISYRSIVELLKQERFLYNAKAGPYKTEDAFALFVERFESFLSKEHSNWASYIKTKELNQPKAEKNK